jgi:hypothetical protein
VTSSASDGAAAAAPARDILTLPQRSAGMVMHPARTLAAAIRDRRWGALLLVMTLAAGGAGAGVMSTAIGQQALVDGWERTAAALGVPLDDAAYARLRASRRWAPAYAAVTALIAVPIAAAGAALALRSTVGRSTGIPFAAVMAMTVHAGVVLMLRQLAGAVLTYATESTASRLTLGAWFPGVDPASAPARLLGFVDLFVVWWIGLLAVGTALLYGRSARRVMGALLAVYLAVAVVAAALLAVLGGRA